jgi:hypothetical protein
MALTIIGTGRTRQVALLVASMVTAAAIASGCRSPIEASRAVDRHEAVVEIHPDGSALVTERLDGALFPGDGTFERVVTGRRADAIEYAGSSVDGKTWFDRSSDSLDVVIGGGPSLHVQWRRVGGTPTPSVLQWRYRLIGATGLREQRGVLQWPVLAVPRGLSVGTSRIELRLPEGVHMLGGTGMAETGWSIETSQQGMVASRSGVGLDPATILAEYPVDISRVSLPQWQLNDDLQGEFAPAFVSAAIFMVVIGVGVIWIVGFQHPTRRVGAEAGHALIAVDGLSAAAVRAVRRGSAPWNGSVSRELAEHGLIDRDRLAVGTGLRTTAWVGLLVALFSVAIGHFVLRRFGWWPHIVPASMSVVALSFLFFSQLFRVLTSDGERLRAVLRGR